MSAPERPLNEIGKWLCLVAVTAAITFAAWSVAAWLLTAAWPWEFTP